MLSYFFAVDKMDKTILLLGLGVLWDLENGLHDLNQCTNQFGLHDKYEYHSHHCSFAHLNTTADVQLSFPIPSNVDNVYVSVHAQAP
jgi:hypothetical protein